MKSLKVIGKDVLTRTFPEAMESGFESTTNFFAHTLDIHRRFGNLYVNVMSDYRKQRPELEIAAFGVKLQMWGMDLGRVGVNVYGVTSLKDGQLPEISPENALQKDIIDIMCDCERIMQTRFAPTHLIVIIEAQGNEWARQDREIYYLEKWQSEEILERVGK